MSLLQRLQRLDDAALPRAGSHGLDRTPTRWERRVAAHATWQAALVAAVVAGVLMSAAGMLLDWAVLDYRPQLNVFVLRALVVGGISFGLFAVGASYLAASVGVRDRLSSAEESQRDDPASGTRP